MAELGYIQIIRKCNQECIICSNPENGKEIDFNEAKKSIDDLKRSGHSDVILTGGDPTLYKKLPELIKYAVKNRIHPRIITNGQKISDMKYLQKLIKVGLKDLHLSIYSNINSIQYKLSQKKDSLANIKKTLDNTLKTDIHVNVNIVINKYNSDHLSKIVSWIVKDYPNVRHFVFNNLDPFMNRVSENKKVVPRFNDFELELHRALEILEKNKKTFRVERVPLCYMTDFEYVSTETRKIVKNEKRVIYFLDEKGMSSQKDWKRDESEKCRVCFLKNICAGIDFRGGYYKKEELYPVFIDPQKIIDKILEK
jgi:MoaA/NifB/PqqE/SkfB family radical SAM enzyme